jgi:hypothetical protein
MKYVLDVLIIAVCMAIFVAIGCVKFDQQLQNGEGAPIITCKRSVTMDEGGVCHNGFACSDGKDHVGECLHEVTK